MASFFHYFFLSVLIWTGKYEEQEGLRPSGKKKPALLFFMNGLAAQHPALPSLLYLVVLLALLFFALVLREARVTASWLSSLASAKGPFLVFLKQRSVCFSSWLLRLFSFIHRVVLQEYQERSFSAFLSRRR